MHKAVCKPPTADRAAEYLRAHPKHGRVECDNGLTAHLSRVENQVVTDRFVEASTSTFPITTATFMFARVVDQFDYVIKMWAPNDADDVMFPRIILALPPCMRSDVDALKDLIRALLPKRFLVYDLYDLPHGAPMRVSAVKLILSTLAIADARSLPAAGWFQNIRRNASFALFGFPDAQVGEVVGRKSPPTNVEWTFDDAANAELEAGLREAACKHYN